MKSIVTYSDGILMLLNSTWETYQSDHMTDINFKKFQNTEVIQSLSSDVGGIELKINKKIARMSPVASKLNNILINNPWIKEKIKMEIRKCF